MGRRGGGKVGRGVSAQAEVVPVHVETGVEQAGGPVHHTRTVGHGTRDEDSRKEATLSEQPPEDRELTEKEKFLFDLLMESAKDGRLCMTIARLDGQERALICTMTKGGDADTLVPIALAITDDDIHRMTVEGEEATRASVRVDGDILVEQ